MTTTDDDPRDTAPGVPPAPSTPPTFSVAADPRRGLGQWGEDLAVQYLRDQGLTVLERNWRCEHGELDVVARDGGWVVVCEVKTRRSSGFGEPVEAVTFAKAMRLRRLAAAWMRAHDEPAEGVRIDVVGILCRSGSPPLVRHVVGVGS